MGGQISLSSFGVRHLVAPSALSFFVLLLIESQKLKTPQLLKNQVKSLLQQPLPGIPGVLSLIISRKRAVLTSPNPRHF